jgi:hypothetical protein
MIPYTLIKNPTKAQLLAMIKVSQEKLSDYGFHIQGLDENSKEYQEMKENIPYKLLTLCGNSVNNGELKTWALYFEQHLEELKKLKNEEDI